MLTYLSPLTGSYETTDDSQKSYTVRVRVSFEADVHVLARDSDHAEEVAANASSQVVLYAADAEIRDVDVFPCLTRAS
jgi:hypothetical protein